MSVNTAVKGVGHLTLQYGNYMEPVRDWGTYIRHFADGTDDIESKKRRVV